MIGNKYTITCVESCINKDKDEVFGSKIYTDFSNIFSSAIHSSSLGEDGRVTEISLVKPI